MLGCILTLLAAIDPVATDSRVLPIRSLMDWRVAEDDRAEGRTSPDQPPSAPSAASADEPASDSVEPPPQAPQQPPAQVIFETRNLVGHTGAVTCVACCSTGRRVVSGGADTTLRLWAADTGLEIKRFEGHDATVTAAAFSPDARLIVSAGNLDRSARIWDVGSRFSIARCTGHLGSVTAVAFSPDGRSVFYATWGESHGLLADESENENTIRHWDLATSSLVRSFSAHDESVNAFALSADGRYMLSGGDDQSLSFWDVNTGRRLYCFGDAHEGAVYAVAFSKGHKRALSFGEDKTVRSWDLRRKRERSSLEAQTKDEVYPCVFSPDQRFVLLVRKEERVGLWDTKTGLCVYRLKGHASRVRCAAFSADGRLVACGCEDGTIHLWALPE